MTAAPTLTDWLSALDATWPAKATHTAGPFVVREGAGGGQRVSSASTLLADVSDADIDAAEALHRSLGQEPLFRLHPGNAALDARLAARGYQKKDVTLLRAAPVSAFAPPEKLRAIPHWPPLSLTRDLWCEDGITPERQAVMERCAGPCIALIGRAGDNADRASGAAFVAIAGEIAMLHALLVVEEMRRRGSAHQMMCQAAKWAQENGASWLSVAVTEANEAAGKLYSSLAMPVVGQYHYRTA